MKVLSMVFAVAGIGAAVAMAPVAAALPNASTRADDDPVPDSRHSQIITSPPAMNNGRVAALALRRRLRPRPRPVAPPLLRLTRFR